MFLLFIASFTITILIVFGIIITNNRQARISKSVGIKGTHTNNGKSKITYPPSGGPPPKERWTKAHIIVADDLTKLPSTYTVFNDCIVNGVEIDHLVCSLAGVVIVKTVDHEGSVSNNGQQLFYDGKEVNKEDVNQLWEQASAVKKLMKEECGEEYFIKVVLCYPNAFVAVQSPIDDAALLNLQFLRPIILANRTFISSISLKKIMSGIYRK